ncbi:MAG: hypothetical protein HFG20_04360 [Anaerotruncus sp.]|nr:hypothetical protein [Anaerotruncus sp.]
MTGKEFTQSPVRWLITITDRGKGEQIAEIYKENGVHIHLLVLGVGTARKDLMEYLGLEPEKDVILSMVPKTQVHQIFAALQERMQFDKPGKGVAFTVPLSGISAAVLKQVDGGDKIKMQVEREIVPETKPEAFEMIVSMVSKGKSDIVVQAAREAGATGGTLLSARGLNSDESEKFFKIKIQPEKEIIFLVVPKSQKHEIMQAICNRVFAETKEHGVAFSIPIDETLGMARR